MHAQRGTAVALVALALAVLVVHAANHWVVTDRGFIVPKEDFSFTPSRPQGPHLFEFITHQKQLDFYRAKTREIDRSMFKSATPDSERQKLPDLLSKMRDYKGRKTLGEVDLNHSTVVLLAHKGILLEEHIDLKSALTKEDKARQPTCGQIELDYSMADYSHLQGVAERAWLPRTPEPALSAAVWPMDDDSKRRSTTEMGARIAIALEKSPASFVALNLAAVYWRVRGDGKQSIECLRRALHHSPWHHRDMALVSLANILHLAGKHQDALVAIKAALDCNESLYLTHFTHGNILAALGELVSAADAYTRALAIDSELGLARDQLEAVTTQIKINAVAARRDYEIKMRKITMVLTPELTWEDFDYEAVESPCHDAICKEHAVCLDVDGKCHCQEGWLAVNGECVPDNLCDNVTCKDNSICRAGRCYCKVGYMVEHNKCVPDPCAGVTCVEHAQCDSATGRCTCMRDFFPFGSECVTKDCVGIVCKPHSFCQRGLCYCQVGYHPNVDVCEVDVPCAKARCPSHATCDAEGDGHCRCDAGYIADIHNNVCVPSSSKASAASAAAAAPQHTPIAPAAAPSAAPTASLAANEDKDHKAASSSSQQQQTQDASFPQAFDDPAWVSEENCPESMRTVPPWNEYASTFLPPEVKGRSLRDFLDLGTALPEKLLEPYCTPYGPDHSAGMMDHVRGIAERNTSILDKYLPEQGLREIATHLLGVALKPAEMGHYVADAMAKTEPTWALFDMAALYWRVMGRGNESLECVRKSLHYSPFENKDVAYTNAANVLHRSGRLEDATVFARLAIMTNDKQRTITHFTMANVLAAQGLLEEAAYHFEQSLRHQPGFELAMHTLKRVRCTQLSRGGADTRELYLKQLELKRHMEEARQLHERLTALKRLVRQDDDNDPQTKAIRAQLLDAERRLNDVLSNHIESSGALQSIIAARDGILHQIKKFDNSPSSSGGASAGGGAAGGTSYAPLAEPEQSKPVPPAKVGAASEGKKGDTSADKVREYTDSEGQRVVVVEYPKSPSIPSLISAVEEMMDREERVEPQVFDDPAWPDGDLCRSHPPEMPFNIFLNTWLSPESKGINLTEHIDFRTPLTTPAHTWRLPYCDVDVPAKNSHTLQHLEGVAMSSSLLGFEEESLTEVLRFLHQGPEPMSFEEVGERVRRALEGNDSSWVVLNLAGLFWRVHGNSTHAVECFRRAFYFSSSTVKDVALVNLANVLHLADYTVDAITLLQMAIQVGPKLAMNHFTMANVLASLGDRGAEEAAFFFETALRFQKDFVPAQEQLLSIRCKQYFDRHGKGRS